jgi:Ni/Fe-hydrogenase subunit HybB-like protein
VIRRPRLSVWGLIFWILIAAGSYAAILRFTRGLGAATHLSDRFPWGLWIGFDVLCGVGLAAGGFTLAAAVHIFNIERYRPVFRPAILTAFLGYVLVIAALLFDLGRPYRIWHPLIMWNPHSVMFEVAWCVTLYTTVLSLEFAPAVFQRLGWRRPMRWMRTVSIPLVIAGVILSTLHQSSLGSLYLIVPETLHPLWYSPILPLLFFVSALCVGLAMTVFESWHSSRAFGKTLELPLLAGMARVLAVLILVYLLARFLDLGRRGALARLADPGIEPRLFMLEIGLWLAGMALLFWRRVRTSPGALYAASLMVIFGFITNRLNVSVTGMEAASGARYIPKWTEVAVTLAIVAMGFAIFRTAVKHLPIFDEGDAEASPPAAPARRVGGEQHAPASAAT